MRDAARAVAGVIGAFAVFFGSLGIFRGWLTRTETLAVVVGFVLLVVVALVPAGKPRPPLYEDWDDPRKG